MDKPDPKQTRKGIDPLVLATVVGRARGHCQYRSEAGRQCDADLVHLDARSGELVDDQVYARILDPALPGERAMTPDERDLAHQDWLADTVPNLLLMCPRHHEQVMEMEPGSYPVPVLEGWRDRALHESEEEEVDPPDGAPKAFDSVDVLYAARDLLDPQVAERAARRSWAYVAGIYGMVAELLDVSEAEAERMVEALTERQEPRRG